MTPLPTGLVRRSGPPAARLAGGRACRPGAGPSPAPPPRTHRIRHPVTPTTLAQRPGTLAPAAAGEDAEEEEEDDRGEAEEEVGSSSSSDGWVDGDRDDEDDEDVDDDDDRDDDEDSLPHSAFDPFDDDDGPALASRAGGALGRDEDANAADDTDDDWPPPALACPAGGPAILPPAAGGDVAAYVDAVLAGSGGGQRHPPPLATIAGMFPYRLDPFQRRAVRAALAGSNVLVCAPTGAGKTAIAVAAALGALAAGKRVVYTTPLKALSNQKLGEFRAAFGADRVGLQTGDATLNAEGDIVVMTTEVLRNILFRADPAAEAEAAEAAAAAAAEAEEAGDQQQQQQGSPPPTSPTTTQVPARVADVGLIVLDEVHYLGDASRGTVWEETIIGAPPGATLLAMSATVRNPADLGDWVASVHGPCVTLRTADRPVPLNWLYAWGEPGGRGGGGGWAPGPARLAPGSGATVEALLTFDRVRPGRPGRLASALRPPRGGGPSIPMAPPDPAALARELDARDLLPAIWFIFSRAGCDATARSLGAGRAVRPPSKEAAAAIAAALAALRADQPEAVREDMVPALLAGVASHHAGCLPGWKGLVEKLFQGGALRLVVATETLAAGINMPARTTVISALARRRGAEGVAPLKHNELLQMAGRAGRRGYDDVGHCVIAHGLGGGGPPGAAALLARGPERLASQFRPGYSMVLNLVATRSLADARAFVERSFGAYLGGEGARRRAAQVDAAERVADHLEEVAEDAAAAADEAAAAAAAAPDASATARKKEARRALRALERAAVADRATRAVASLPPTLPCLALLDLSGADPDGGDAVPALLIRFDAAAGGDGGGGGEADVALPRAPVPGEPGGEGLALLDDNRVVRLAAAHLAAVAGGPPPADWLATHGGPGGVVEAVAAAAATAASAGGWAGLAGGALATPGTGGTAALAAGLADAAQTAGLDLDLLLPPAATELSLKAARSEVRALRAAARRESRTAREEKAGRRGRAKKKGDRFAPAGGADQTPAARLAATAWEAARQARAARSTARAMRTALEEGAASTWRSFEAVAGVLAGADAVEEGGEGGGGARGDGARPPAAMRLLPLGEVARSLHGENELWLACLFASPGVQALPPPELAGAVAAVLAGELSLRPGVRARYPPSPAVIDAIAALDATRASLARLQWRYGVDSPLAVDLRLSGVVQAWASGLDWAAAVADCALDPGDVARLMTRTVDLLRQAAHCDALPPGLRAAARRAAKACDRKPIADLVMG